MIIPDLSPPLQCYPAERMLTLLFPELLLANSFSLHKSSQHGSVPAPMVSPRHLERLVLSSPLSRSTPSARRSELQSFYGVRRLSLTLEMGCFTDEFTPCLVFFVCCIAGACKNFIRARRIVRLTFVCQSLHSPPSRGQGPWPWSHPRRGDPRA